MKVIMNTFNITQLGNEGMWEYLKNKGMDMDKPIYAYPCKASNTAYGFAYEGTKLKRDDDMDNLRQKQTIFWRIGTDILVCIIVPIAIAVGVLRAIRDLIRRYQCLH